jgi:hypothetical protein
MASGIQLARYHGVHPRIQRTVATARRDLLELHHLRVVCCVALRKG